MLLRTRLIALFLGLATLPLAALGVFEYLQSRRALEALVAAQVSVLAHSAAEQVADRYARRRSDLLLLAENTETQRLYRAGPSSRGRVRPTSVAAKPPSRLLTTSLVR